MINRHLMHAASNGDRERVRELLAQGAEINHTTAMGDTALIEAARGGHTEIVRELLAYGAEINHQSHWCDTALIQAARYGHVETVKELLAKGAEINTLTLHNRTALIEAARNSWDGIKADRKSWDGGILMRNARSNYREIIQELLAQGAKIPFLYRRISPLEVDNIIKQESEDRQNYSEKKKQIELFFLPSKSQDGFFSMKRKLREAELPKDILNIIDDYTRPADIAVAIKNKNPN